MSLIMRAPAAIAARITAALRVSIETSTPALASASITGAVRLISSSAEIASAPGRVDSPPTSTMSAPSARSCKPCATAAAGSKNCPPSEKLSGVTLTTPISSGRCAGRPSGQLGDAPRRAQSCAAAACTSPG
jgi:hypothetical protein